jgi:ABC-type multidrug transport system permease subunit
MGSRERKRAERRKRKDRSGDRRAELEAARVERAERTEAKNRAAREALDPLAPDERPTVVGVAAAIAGALALGTLIAYAVGLEVGTFDDFGNETGQAKPSLFYTIVSALVLGTMAWGLWKARYWAVLGFQTILVLIIVVAILALIQVSDPLRGLGLFAILAVASLLFYRMVKAMARIQGPERRTYG